MITKVFIPAEGNLELLYKVCNLAKKYSFSEWPDTLFLLSWSKAKRMQGLEDFINKSFYLTLECLDYEPVENERRMIWVYRFEKKKFDVHQKMMSDFKEIKEWIIRNGEIDHSFSKKKKKVKENLLSSAALREIALH